VRWLRFVVFTPRQVATFDGGRLGRPMVRLHLMQSVDRLVQRFVVGGSITPHEVEIFAVGPCIAPNLGIILAPLGRLHLGQPLTQRSRWAFKSSNELLRVELVGPAKFRLAAGRRRYASS